MLITGCSCPPTSRRPGRETQFALGLQVQHPCYECGLPIRLVGTVEFCVGKQAREPGTPGPRGRLTVSKKSKMMDRVAFVVAVLVLCMCTSTNAIRAARLTRLRQHVGVGVGKARTAGKVLAYVVKTKPPPFLGKQAPAPLRIAKQQPFNAAVCAQY